jgi:hypothetical protein
MPERQGSLEEGIVAVAAIAIARRLCGIGVNAHSGYVCSYLRLVVYLR